MDHDVRRSRRFRQRNDYRQQRDAGHRRSPQPDGCRARKHLVESRQADTPHRRAVIRLQLRNTFRQRHHVHELHPEPHYPCKALVLYRRRFHELPGCKTAQHARPPQVLPPVAGRRFAHRQAPLRVPLPTHEHKRKLPRELRESGHPQGCRTLPDLRRK